MKFDKNNIIIDTEISSHCNAQCDFCPRDTYEKYGHMSIATFEKLLERVKEFKLEPAINACGIGGDPSNNPNLVKFIQMATDAGIPIYLVSNGSLITRKKSEELIKAGVKRVSFSASCLFEEYEKFYQLPFKKLVQNVKDFLDVSNGEVEFLINLPRRKHYSGDFSEEKAFWRKLGVKNFLDLKYSNHMMMFSNEEAKELEKNFQVKKSFFDKNNMLGLCPIPFKVISVAWDGESMICDKDHTRSSSVGNIHSHSLEELLEKKINYYKQDDKVCKHCNIHHDIVSKFIENHNSQDLIKARQLENIIISNKGILDI